MAFVSVTRLRIRALRFMPAFFVHTLRSQRQVRSSAGYLDGSLLADRARVFWTLTLWDGEGAMRRFMTGGAHRAAMPKLIGWCDEASVVHWVQDAAVLPGWDEADRRMRADGRPSKVRHPSPDHAAMTYRPPRTAGAVPLRP